jgi:hypothetical protein
MLGITSCDLSSAGLPQCGYTVESTAHSRPMMSRPASQARLTGTELFTVTCFWGSLSLRTPDVRRSSPFWLIWGLSRWIKWFRSPLLWVLLAPTNEKIQTARRLEQMTVLRKVGMIHFVLDALTIGCVVDWSEGGWRTS